jgi:PAS domain S-box-containing protein
MADGIVVVDADERIVRVNPAFCAITGFSPGALEGQPVSSLCADGEPCELGRLVSQTGSGHWSGISMASAPTGATTSATR